MPPRKRSGGSGGSKKDEVQQSKSPAEFFAENQSIAGFDNAGKSLYTTLRELIENSLDACESVNVLPDITVSIDEMTEAQFNKSRGVPNSQDEKRDAEILEDGDKNAKGKTKEKKKRAGGDAYFTVTVRDNGCGMAHDAIPDLLGRVLSGSKYGVRQTRGKFGLGAKMALIWSKKSTGVPIRVKSSHVKGVRGGGGGSLLDDEGKRKIGPKVSTCVLDIGESHSAIFCCFNSDLTAARHLQELSACSGAQAKDEQRRVDRYRNPGRGSWKLDDL